MCESHMAYSLWPLSLQAGPTMPERSRCIEDLKLYFVQFPIFVSPNALLCLLSNVSSPNSVDLPLARCHPPPTPPHSFSLPTIIVPYLVVLCRLEAKCTNPSHPQHAFNICFMWRIFGEADLACMDIENSGDTRDEDVGSKTLQLWSYLNVPFVVPEG
jgi:hypothetical protein